MSDDTQTKALVPLQEGKLVPTDLEGLWRMADIFSRSGMVPSDDNRKPERLFAKMAYGMEVGMSHMASIKSISLVNGVPSIYGPGFLGIIQSSGKLEDHVEYFEVKGKRDDKFVGPVDLKQWPEDITAVCILKRKGVKTSYEGRFSVADAIRMGKWNTKTSNGKKSVWQNHPKDMLMWRSRHKAADLGFSDVTCGMVPAAVAQDYVDLSPTEESGDIYDLKPEEVKEAPVSPDEFYKAFEKAEHISEFVALVAKHSDQSVDRIKAEAMKDIKGFGDQYDKWVAGKSKEAKTPADKPKVTKPKATKPKATKPKEEPKVKPEPEPEAKTVTEIQADLAKKFPGGINSLEDKYGDEKKEDPEVKKSVVKDEIPPDLLIKAMLSATKKTLKPLIEENIEKMKVLRMTDAEQYRELYEKWRKWYMGTPWPLQKQTTLFTDDPEAAEVLNRMKSYFPEYFERAIGELKMGSGCLSNDAIRIVEEKVIDLIHKGKAKKRGK